MKKFKLVKKTGKAPVAKVKLVTKGVVPAPKFRPKQKGNKYA